MHGVDDATTHYVEQVAEVADSLTLALGTQNVVGAATPELHAQCLEQIGR